MTEWFEVWSGTLDEGLYEAEVFWDGEASGILLVYNADTKVLLHGVHVEVRHHPLFGADIEDVQVWQHIVTEAVDHPEIRAVAPAAKALAETVN